MGAAVSDSVILPAGGNVMISAADNVVQRVGRTPGSAASGDHIFIDAGRNVGLITLPLSVDALGSASVDTARARRLLSRASSIRLDECGLVLSLCSGSVLSSKVGSIPSSSEERASFKLDSSQFPTESRIFSIERTGILPPEDQRE